MGLTPARHDRGREVPLALADDESQPRPLGREPADFFRRAVGAAVVHDDKLEGLVRESQGLRRALD